MADQLTLFEPGRADFAPHTTASPPRFKKLSTPLLYIHADVSFVLYIMYAFIVLFFIEVT